jgi:MFS transporter, DHA1 family, multidrug resistance protein
MTASKTSFTVILVMGLLTAIGPLSIDMYLPAFPAIAKSLHTTVSQITLSLSSFFIGISSGQLLYGPLLERFGRKPPLYAGLCLYLVASGGCAFAQSANMLIGLRLLQGVGSCAGMVAARAMVRDLFDVRQNAKVFSMLMLVVSVSPVIAPTLGGYITSALGWRYIFGMLIFVVGLILAGTCFLLPESRKPDPTFSLKPAPILANFKSVLKQPQFLTYALTGAISYAGLYAYIGGAPYVFMELFKVTEQQFGWIFSFVAAGLIGSSQLNNLALKKYSSEQIVRVACSCQAFIGLMFIVFTLAGASGLFTTILLIFLFLCCQGFIFPNATALALAPLGNNAGNASALVGAIQMTIGASASAIIGVIENKTALPMAGLMTLCAALALAAFSFGKKYLITKQNDTALAEANIEMIESF